jgi:F-type H+-transporting ATPase subunit gamma
MPSPCGEAHYLLIECRPRKCSERLLPLGGPVTGQTTSLPLTQEPAGRVGQRVIEHYFFHTLLARLLHAIRVENHMRLTQMENALRHLGQGSEDMQRRRNRLRQEEIVEEIELIAQGRSGF